MRGLTVCDFAEELNNIYYNIQEAVFGFVNSIFVNSIV
jgi:hypothetical protein